jgi:hypothetical protein
MGHPLRTFRPVVNVALARLSPEIRCPTRRRADSITRGRSFGRPCFAPQAAVYGADREQGLSRCFIGWADTPVDDP